MGFVSRQQNTEWKGQVSCFHILIFFSFFFFQDCCQGKVKLVGRCALFLFVWQPIGFRMIHNYNVHTVFMHTDKTSLEKKKNGEYTRENSIHKNKTQHKRIKKSSNVVSVFIYVKETNPEKFMQNVLTGVFLFNGGACAPFCNYSMFNRRFCANYSLASTLVHKWIHNT